MPLNAKQQRFCEEYIKDLNGTQAAIRAGYSKKTAYVIAYENLRKPEIVKEIDLYKEKFRQESKLDGDMIKDELRAISFSNIQDFITSGNAIVDLTTLPRYKTRAVAAIKTRIITTGTGRDKVTETITELKLVDKRAALVDLGKTEGIFEKDNDQRRPEVSVPFNDDQVDKIIDALRSNK